MSRRRFGGLLSYSKDNDGQTTLWWATHRGHEAVVKLLLETGKVDTDSKGDATLKGSIGRARGRL